MRPAALEALHEGLPEIEIARRVAAGDQDAFQLLMRRHNQIMYRTARSILKDDAEAEDAVQEAYLLAYRAMDKFRGDAKLSTWLVRIVVNEAIARMRKRSRRAEVIRLGGETELDSLAAEVNMNESTPEQPDQAAARGEARRLLEAKIDGLPDAFRTVFVLRAVEEMSVEEAAVCLGTGTLKTQADVLRFAATLEKGAVSAYLGAVPVFGNKDLAKAAASILGDEAMHWAILRNAIGESPVPSAFMA